MSNLEVRTVPWGSDDIIDLLEECFTEIHVGREWQPRLEDYARLPLHISGLFDEGRMVGLGMYLLSPDLNLGCDMAIQIALYVCPGPRRGWGYVRLLRHVMATLGPRVGFVLGGAKRPPRGDLGRVFQKVGWTADEVVYIWEPEGAPEAPQAEEV